MPRSRSTTAAVVGGLPGEAAVSTARSLALGSRSLLLPVLVVLALALDLAAEDSLARAGQSGADVEILFDAHPSSSSATTDLGRPFGTAPCLSRRRAETILGLLLPDAQRIFIQRFDGREWRDHDTVKAYMRRLLGAVPEGGMPSPTVYWAEWRPAEVFASVEFSDGQRRPLQMANGYVHVVDGSGCEWWGRYLGPDRSKWVVRP